MLKRIIRYHSEDNKIHNEQIEQAVLEISDLEFKNSELEKQVQELNQKVTVLTLENNQMKLQIEELNEKIKHLLEAISQIIDKA